MQEPLSYAVVTLLVTVFAAGCGGQAPAPTTKLVPSATAATLASASASAIAEATTSAEVTRAKPAIPATPPGVDAGKFELLASLCAVGSYDGPSGTEVGCRFTPPYDKAEELPDGQLRVVTDRNQLCVLGGIELGSFTANNKEQAVLRLESCGPERWNGSTPGDLVVAERTPEGWNQVALKRGTNLDGCDKLKRDGRTVFVCDDVTGDGRNTLRWSYSLDFSAVPEERLQIIAKTYSGGSHHCGESSAFSADPSESRVTALELGERSYKDVDGDGDDDLVRTVERGSLIGTSVQSKRIDTLCKRARPDQPLWLEPRNIVGAMRSFKLVFLNSPNGFRPDTASSKLLREWEEESPSFWMSQVGGPPEEP
jgi:hypothetical protein